MKQKKTLQILLLVFAGLIVLYTGVNLYQKQQSSKEDSDQTMISDLKSLTSISYNNNGTTLIYIHIFYLTQGNHIPLIYDRFQINMQISGYFLIFFHF